jgi:hypothetical protein
MAGVARAQAIAARWPMLHMETKCAKLHIVLAFGHVYYVTVPHQKKSYVILLYHAGNFGII